MKKFVSFVLINLFLITFMYSQQARKSSQNKASEVTEISVKATGDSVQFDIFFSAPIDTRTFSASTISVNSKKIDGNTKITFNRECTQVRFVVKTSLPATIAINGVKSADGSAIPSITASKLKGDSTWKNR